MRSAPPVDVIVPVYNAVEDLRACVASVRRHAGDEAFRLVLIDDCSPDPRIAGYFAALAAEGDPRLLLLRNDENLGFVATANRGMALDAARDVVLLNSDTLVTAGWLGKLRRCAASHERIGTITPFSNNAEICSFPDFCRNVPLEELPDIERVARAIEQAAVPCYPEIPTAVGFCMFIRRSLLAEIGPFDADTFRLGYGEENDFCMRARNAGWRNVLCDDTFVAHTGGRSFTARKRALMEENGRKLVERHPAYPQLVHEFIAADPLRPLRQWAQSRLRALAQDDRPGVLHVLHGRQGGTERHVRDLMRARDAGVRQYLLCVMEDSWRIEDGAGEETLCYELSRQPDEPWAELLQRVCETFSIDLCHVHHIAGAREGLLLALQGLEVPFGFTLHDFYLACPPITFMDAEGRYCREQTGVAQCSACLRSQPAYRGIGIEAWREGHLAILRAARFVIAPSQWVADTARRYFGDLPLEIIPHGIDLGELARDADPGQCSTYLLPRDGKLTAGVLGAIGPVKGARMLERLVERTRARNLPVRWVVIGYTDVQYQPRQDPDRVLTIHGPYTARQMPSLVDHYRIDLAVFPSAGPESFSYTLSEARMLGLLALVPPIGALGERVVREGGGWLMSDWEDPDAILDDILRVMSAQNADERTRMRAQLPELHTESLQEMAQETFAVYREVPRPVRAERADTALSRPLWRERWVAAADRALSGRDGAPRSGLGARLMRIALHRVLRLRYTPPGRWLYRVTPLAWQHAIKQRLLGRS